MGKIIAIIQARMGSTRLPGKVLKEIQGKTVLNHVIERVKKSKYINDIIIATTNLERDNIIYTKAIEYGVKVFRGSEEDVLERYYNAAKQYGAEIIVRITSDCPVIDWNIIDKIIEYYLDTKSDYVSNTVDRTYPRGLDLEVFSFNSLEQAYREAVDNVDREHVTPYIWRNPNKFIILQYKNKENYSHLRWTLDTKEDLELIREIYNSLYKDKKHFTFEDIIREYSIHPDWEKVNAHIEQKKI